jgi:hypothetical protein
MTTFRQFRDLPEEDRVSTFERLFRVALESFLPDLASAPWHVREREVVNLFVFGYLLPQFQAEEFDVRQIGIEIPVEQFRESDKAKFGKYADIVVWPHNNSTIWLTCKPLVHIEWKNISCREEHPGALRKDHEQDIRYLVRDRQKVSVSYAILTEWHPFPRERRMGQLDRYVEVCCKRISDTGDPEDFFSLNVETTCSEGAITVLRGDVKKVRSRPQACPVCIPDSSAVPVCIVPTLAQPLS